MDSKLKAIIEAYKTWVKNNPAVVSDVETVLTWSSYFVASKINSTPVLSEFVYSASKLFTLFNDRIIQEAYGLRPNIEATIEDKLKMFLTVIHYSEVFLELLVRRKNSSRSRWTAITIIQLAKCASSLFLLYKYKQAPISHPPIPMLQRKKLALTEDENSNCYVLKRSGKVVRRVEGAPPIALRDWQPIQQELKIPNPTREVIIAETVHILKPLIHLGSMGCFGMNSWKQLVISFGLDLWSLRMYSRNYKSLPNDQKLEISRRKLGLLLYILRSPMFEKYSQSFINRSLDSMSNKIPGASYICNPLSQYLSHWQDIYFYMWSS